MVGELHGKVALVTGAATGIGRATALALGEAGADVLVHCNTSREDADIVAGLVRDLGRRAHVLHADLAERAEVAALADAAQDQWGHVDVLVNNAATLERQPRDPVTQGGDFGHHMDDWDRVLDVNLRAPYELTWRLARRMMERGSGCIVNVASISGMYALTDVPLYSLSKAALLHFTRQAAQHYAPKVRVNAVAPGIVRTRLSEVLWKDQEGEVAQIMPLGRIGDPADVGDAVAFLASDSASWITGETLVIDGGQLLRTAQPGRAA